MPRPRPYDLDERLAYWESGNYRSAPDVMEAAGIPAEHLRSVQKAINRYSGPRPKRLPPIQKDPLRRRVIATLAASGVNVRLCTACLKASYWPMYFRETEPDDDSLISLRLICRHCKRGGDF